MINLKKDQRTIRETAADFEYTDESGELKTQSIRVLYYSPTVADNKRERDEMKAVQKRAQEDAEFDGIWWSSDTLFHRLHSLPDLIDPATGEPHKITKELLESFDVKNLDRIGEAIVEDLRPKSQAATSRQGSEATAAEAKTQTAS